MNGSTLGAAALSLCMAASAAGAADMSDLPLKAPSQRAPAVNWTGFYAGINLGYGWGDPGSSLNWESAASTLANAPLTPGSYATRTSGAIGGAQLGFNFQTGRFVWGAETDFQFTNMHGSMTTPSTFLPNLIDFAHFGESQRLKTLGTVRGRAGFLPADDLLLFVTGGFAYGSASAESHWQYDTPPFAHYDGAASTTRTGYAVGAGAEWAFSPRWSMRAEYLHFDLGTFQIVGSQPGNTTFFTFLNQKINGDIVRGALNFHF